MIKKRSSSENSHTSTPTVLVSWCMAYVVHVGESCVYVIKIDKTMGTLGAIVRQQTLDDRSRSDYCSCSIQIIFLVLSCSVETVMKFPRHLLVSTDDPSD